MSPAPEGLYAAPPLRIEDDIPVFSNVDTYVKNYEQIAHDHIAAMRPDSANPFIPDKLWTELEQSTRDLITRHVAPGGRVLDVGVGMGRTLAPFATLERFGIDISMEYLKFAKAAGFEVAFSRIEDMPYPDEFFDAVITCDVLEHVIDLHRCCEQIVRVLKPGGTLIVRVPHLEVLDAYLNKDLPYEFIHLRSLGVAGLRLLFDKIYGCDYVEHSLVAPFLQGPNTIKVQLPTQDSPLFPMLKSISEKHPLWPLKQVMKMSQEELNSLVYALRDNHPDEFERFKGHLLLPMDANVVFRKRA